MKNLHLTENVLIIAIAFMVVMGCKKTNNVDPVIVPAISGISPLTGLPGSSVTITGSNFGTDATKDTVRFNGSAATISSATATSIVVTVPGNATSGKISVTTNGKTLVYPTEFVVKVPVPEISNVTMTAIAGGDMIYITGNNFNPDGSKNKVMFAGVNATIISASTTQLLAQVYLTKATTGQVTVTAYSTTLTYPTSFNVSPYLTSSLGQTAMGYLAADASGNIYGESGNAVLKVSSSGTASTLATIGASGSQLKGTAVDAAGNVYVTSYSDHKIYKVSPAGTVSAFAGNGASGYADGQGVAAQFIAPVSLTIDASGNLFVCDSARVRKITPDGLVSTFAGNATPGNTDGQGISASFGSLIAITAGKDGSIFVMNTAGLIRKITSAGLVSTLNLQGPLVGNNEYNHPVYAHGIAGSTQIAADPFGNLFVCNTLGIIFGTSNANAGVSFPVYMIDQTGFVTQFTTAEFVGYQGITADKSGNIYISQRSYAYDGSFITKYAIQ